MKYVRPHEAFKYSRADEVAETWETPEWLYQELWEIVAFQKPIPNLEDSGPHDHVGHESLSKHWRKLSIGAQCTLNRLAVERDAEWDAIKPLPKPRPEHDQGMDWYYDSLTEK